MTREELKNMKAGQKLYIPIIKWHFRHSVGNSVIGTCDYPFCEVFHLAIQDILIFDYNEALKTIGRGDTLKEIEECIANFKQKQKESKDEDMKNLPILPWWYGRKTILLKFDLSELSDNDKESFNNTYGPSGYVPSYFSDAAYCYDEFQKYYNEKYLTFDLCRREGEELNDEDFEKKYQGQALSSFFKSKKKAEQKAKKINQKSIKIIDDEIKELKDIKVEVLDNLKTHNILH